MNEMRKLMEAIDEAQGAKTIPTIEKVRAWRIVDENGEEELYTMPADAVIEYAERYADYMTDPNEENIHQNWDSHYNKAEIVAGRTVYGNKK